MKNSLILLAILVVSLGCESSRHQTSETTMNPALAKAEKMPVGKNSNEQPVNGLRVKFISGTFANSCSENFDIWVANSNPNIIKIKSYYEGVYLRSLEVYYK
jgi:hypothetical protein